MEEERIEVEMNASVYDELTAIAVTAGEKWKEAIENGDFEKAKIYLNALATASDKLRAFDENNQQLYKTEAEIQCKLEMNKLDNETKMKNAEAENELRRAQMQNELILGICQLVVNASRDAANLGFGIAKTNMLFKTNCVQMAWESSGYNPNNSKASRTMINVGTKYMS